MGKRALVVLAEGNEEMEVVIPIDVLRRAEVEVTVAGLNSAQAVVCSRQVLIVPDTTLAEAISGPPFDIIILPGGRGGSQAFVDSPELGAALKVQDNAGRLIAAVCAAPRALKQYGIGLGKKLTSYPTAKDQLKDSYDYQEDRVVVDGNLITSRGPGTALEWSLKITEALLGKEKSDKIGGEMLAP